MNARAPFPFPRLTIVISLAAVVAFIVLTPGSGILDKADMVGYAVCHRLASHSFFIGGRQLPLCARCTGTFIGGLLGFFGQEVMLKRRRAANFPPRSIIAVLAGFTFSWAGDGLNSYLALAGGPHLYEPQNWLRLTTGALNGLTMSAILYPTLNFTLWREYRDESNIRRWRELAVLVLLEVGLIGLVLTRWPVLLYPLAILSALGVLTMLTGANSMLVMILLRRENQATNWREAGLPFLAGLTVSLLQIGLIDFMRYQLTGTLSGFPGLR